MIVNNIWLAFAIYFFNWHIFWASFVKTFKDQGVSTRCTRESMLYFYLCWNVLRLTLLRLNTSTFPSGIKSKKSGNENWRLTHCEPMCADVAGKKCSCWILAKDEIVIRVCCSSLAEKRQIGAPQYAKMSDLICHKMLEFSGFAKND